MRVGQIWQCWSQGYSGIILRPRPGGGFTVKLLNCDTYYDDLTFRTISNGEDYCGSYRDGAWRLEGVHSNTYDLKILLYDPPRT